MHQFIQQILLFMEGLGYWGIMLGLMIEVIPSEIVLAYAGYLVYQGVLNIPMAVLFGTIGGVIAQIFVYWVGRYGGRPFLAKYGKYLLIHKKHLDLSEQWFERYGTGVIFTARFIPVVRHAISIPAGIARMSLIRFTFYTTLAIIPWSILFIYLGKSLGEGWEQVNEKAAGYVQPIVVVAVVLFVLYFLVKMFRKRRTKTARYGDAGEKETAHQLRYIGKEYRVLNARHVRAGAGAQEFDHIVVGPNGVFHIDSKHWSGEIRFTENGVVRSKEGHHGDPTAQLYRHEYVLKELLREHKKRADVTGILCFTHPDSTLTGKSPAFVALKPDRLLHHIKTHRARKSLAPGEVEDIARLIQEHSVPSK
ncbi:MAG: dedA family protein [Paenibacillaceae bacterium]|jgi:membrane protein DedA with SNARE-associated domain|nr:dedA family protein [Paenibacillaceae bacterium]